MQDRELRILKEQSMAARKKQKAFFRKFSSYREAEERVLDYWLTLTPEERVAAVDSCLIDQLRLQGKSDVSPPRLRKTCRVIRRKRG